MQCNVSWLEAESVFCADLVMGWPKVANPSSFSPTSSSFSNDFWFGKLCSQICNYLSFAWHRWHMSLLALAPLPTTFKLLLLDGEISLLPFWTLPRGGFLGDQKEENNNDDAELCRFLAELAISLSPLSLIFLVLKFAIVEHFSLYISCFCNLNSSWKWPYLIHNTFILHLSNLFPLSKHSFWSTSLMGRMITQIYAFSILPSSQWQFFSCIESCFMSFLMVMMMVESFADLALVFANNWQPL